MDKTSALRAIAARVQGEYDAPELVAFGPLSPDTLRDVALIAEGALAEDAPPAKAPFSSLGPLKKLDERLKDQGYPTKHPYRRIVAAMADVDSDISRSDYYCGDLDGADDRPPNGDDYNDLWTAIKREIEMAVEATK